MFELKQQMHDSSSKLNIDNRRHFRRSNTAASGAKTSRFALVLVAVQRGLQLHVAVSALCMDCKADTRHTQMQQFAMSCCVL